MVYTLEVTINLSVLVVCTTRTISAPALRVSGLFLCLKNFNIARRSGFKGALRPCGSGAFRIH